MITNASPSERESHSCVFYRGQVESRPKLIVYGGMNGHRLGDLWSFHLGTNKRSAVSLARFISYQHRFLAVDTTDTEWLISTTAKSSFGSCNGQSVCVLGAFVYHSVVVLRRFRMYVFGGWVPLIPVDKTDQYTNEKEWKCTNTLAALNLGKERAFISDSWRKSLHSSLENGRPIKCFVFLYHRNQYLGTSRTGVSRR
jgi:host cell factor